MANSTVGYQPEHFDVPTNLTFSLPDSTSVRAVESPTGITVYLAAAGSEPSTTPLATLEFLGRTLRTSLHGVVNDDRAQHVPVLHLCLPFQTTLRLSDVWAILYALWIRRSSTDVVPLSLDTFSISNVDDILLYLTHTGLGFCPPDATTPTDLLVSRLAFWQGAGAPVERSWHRAPVPHPSLSSLTAFAFTPSFTRATNVCTVHPLRPPKPAPGTILYSRYIFAVNQTLTLIHIDVNDSVHFEAYCRWQNSDRVNHGWRERGDEIHHRRYIEEKSKDKHSMGFLVAWDGELAGYGEMSWVKEDHMGTFVGGLGDYDQGTHLLVGEQKFRGHTRFSAIMTSMKHMCFLRESRTEVVVGEPRTDLPIIPKLITSLPQEVNREFELPHKRAVYFVLRRQRFFEAGLFY